MPNLTFESPARRDTARFVAYAAWGALLLYGGAFLYLAVRHILYPGFVEPMEGDALQQIERAAHGLPLYPKPDGNFVALTYLPFYYFAAAPLYQIFGDSLMGPRLLSVISAVLAGVLVWLWARAASGERTTAHLAAAFYFGGYRVMDAYLTCALPDAFLLFWILLGWYFLARGTRRGHDAIWLLSFTLAFWTKQQGALYFGLAIVYALWLRPPAGVGETRLPRWTLVLGLILGGPLAYKFIGPLLGERFFYHTLIVPGRWEKSPFVALSRTAFVLLCFVPFGMLLAAFYALPQHWRDGREWLAKLRNPVIYFTLTALCAATFTMMSLGSSNNHYIPFMAGLTILSSLGVRHLLAREAPDWTKKALAGVCLASVLMASFAIKKYGEHNVPLFLPPAILAWWIIYTRAARHEWSSWGRRLLLAGLLVAGQFAVSFYYLPDYLPNDAYQAELTALQSELQKLDGPVIWLPYGNVPQALSGRKLERAPSWVVLEDIERQNAPPQEIAADLAPWRTHLRQFDKLYLLTDSHLDETPGWQAAAADFELVRDFGKEFADVRQIAVHWYGGGNYPHYLYRRRPAPLPGKTVVEK